MTAKKSSAKPRAAAPARKRLAVKKDTLKDLGAGTDAKKVKGGAWTYSCGGKSIVR
jgi:hypothetical protein